MHRTRSSYLRFIWGFPSTVFFLLSYLAYATIENNKQQIKQTIGNAQAQQIAKLNHPTYPTPKTTQPPYPVFNGSTTSPYHVICRQAEKNIQISNTTKTEVSGGRNRVSNVLPMCNSTSAFMGKWLSFPSFETPSYAMCAKVRASLPKRLADHATSYASKTFRSACFTPRDCVILHFPSTVHKLESVLRGKEILFVGDSLGGQLYVAVRCAIERLVRFDAIKTRYYLHVGLVDVLPCRNACTAPPRTLISQSRSSKPPTPPSPSCNKYGSVVPHTYYRLPYHKLPEEVRCEDCAAMSFKGCPSSGIARNNSLYFYSDLPPPDAPYVPPGYKAPINVVPTIPPTFTPTAPRLVPSTPFSASWTKQITNHTAVLVLNTGSWHIIKWYDKLDFPESTYEATLRSLSPFLRSLIKAGKIIIWLHLPPFEDHSEVAFNQIANKVLSPIGVIMINASTAVTDRIKMDNHVTIDGRHMSNPSHTAIPNFVAHVLFHILVEKMVAK